LQVFLYDEIMFAKWLHQKVLLICLSALVSLSHDQVS
jgi:hypothetical protein